MEKSGDFPTWKILRQRYKWYAICRWDFRWDRKFIVYVLVYKIAHRNILIENKYN